jgi:prophage regulatory protein
MQNLSGQLYRMKDLIACLPLSKSSIWAGVKDGTFPKPIRLSKRTVAWTQGQLDAWLTSRGGV